MIVPVAPVDGGHDVQGLASQLEAAVSRQLRREHGEEAGSEEILLGAAVERFDGEAQGLVGPVELVGHAIGVRQLRQGPAAEVGGPLRPEGVFVQEARQQHGGVGELDHLGGVFIAQGPTPLEERLEEGDPGEIGGGVHQGLQAAVDEEDEGLPPALLRSPLRGVPGTAEDGEGPVDRPVIGLRRDGGRESHEPRRGLRGKRRQEHLIAGPAAAEKVQHHGPSPPGGDAAQHEPFQLFPSRVILIHGFPPLLLILS